MTTLKKLKSINALASGQRMVTLGKTNFKKNSSEVTQKEIIEFEEANTGVIRLYLEGSFYKAYERSAFAFCTRIKDYKVLRKESKTLGRDILYVGFPIQRQVRPPRLSVGLRLCNIRLCVPLLAMANDCGGTGCGWYIAQSGESCAFIFCRRGIETGLLPSLRAKFHRPRLENRHFQSRHRLR